jgi:hypothetical protein
MGKPEQLRDQKRKGEKESFSCRFLLLLLAKIEKQKKKGPDIKAFFSFSLSTLSKRN